MLAKGGFENDVRKALGKRGAGPWRAYGMTWKIRRGETRLEHISTLARIAKCSLTYLTSGGIYEADNELSPRDAIEKTLMHKGLDKHDFARKLGYKDFTYIGSIIDNETIPVRTLLRMCRTLHMPLWKILCDEEYHRTEPLDLIPSEWDQIVELNLMGWLDAKKE